MELSFTRLKGKIRLLAFYAAMLLRKKRIVLLFACLLIGLVLVLLFLDSTAVQHILRKNSPKVSGDPESATFILKAPDIDPVTNSAILQQYIHVYKKSTSDNSSYTPQSLLFISKASHKRLVTTRDLYEHLVVVTAFSNNHFEEAKDMIASVQTCLPKKKIIVYDLGLNSIQRNQTLKYCNVELRPFPFKDYQQPHVRKLYTYAWKPIITKLVSLEYDVIMYGDASLRMKSCNIRRALNYLFTFPFLNMNPLFFSTIEFTHDGMMEYLHYPKARKDIAHVQTLEASCYLMWAHSVMQEKLIEPWLDCALHQECIAPEGSKLWPCNFTTFHDGHYIGCHRYDQSALNLILTREFGVDAILKGGNRAITSPVWKITKRITHDYSISYCT